MVRIPACHAGGRGFESRPLRFNWIKIMLQTIREYTQGWIAGIIVSVIILTFALWGIHSYFGGGVTNNVVATVNGATIAKEQLAVAYERLRRQMQNQYGANYPATAQDEADLKNRALQVLVQIQVLKQASIAQRYHIGDRQVDNYLESMPDFQVDNRFSWSRFQEFLSSTLMSTSEFWDFIKTSLLIDQPKLGVIFSSFALPEEVKYTIELVNQERDIAYLILPFQYFSTQQISVSAEKIRAYYDQHQQEFKTPEQVEVEYVELSLKDLSATLSSPSESVLKNFYNENVNTYTQPTSWQLALTLFPVSANAKPEDVQQVEKKANALFQAVQQGGDFTKLSQEATGQAPKVQAWQTLSQVTPALQKAVVTLAKPLQVAGPVKTPQGFVVLQALEMKEPKIQSFSEAKEKVKEALLHQQAEEKFAQLRERLADLAYEHPDSLQAVAKEMNLPIQASGLFTREKGGKGISTNKKIRDVAYTNEILTMQNNSDVIQLSPDTAVVLRMKSHQASTLLPLASVSAQIEDKLRAAEREAKAAQFAEEIKSKLTFGTDPQQIEQTYHLVWNKAGYIGRYAVKVDPSILDTAFRLPRPTDNKALYSVARLPSGYAIVALQGVRDGMVTDKTQYAVFAEQVQNSQGLLEYELYKQSQISHAKIKIEK